MLIVPFRVWRIGVPGKKVGRVRSRLHQIALALTVALVIGGCAAGERQPAVPVAQTEQATVLGIANARFWPDTQGPALVQEAMQALERERAAGGNPRTSAANFLAISGGGDNGAFAAGLLAGWSDSGTTGLQVSNRRQHRRAGSSVCVSRSSL